MLLQKYGWWWLRLLMCAVSPDRMLLAKSGLGWVAESMGEWCGYVRWSTGSRGSQRNSAVELQREKNATQGHCTIARWGCARAGSSAMRAQC